MTEQDEAASKGDGGSERGMRKVVQGIVTSTKMDKTITVETSYLKMHPRYKKFVKHHTKFKAHDADSSAKEGDLVEIVQTRPLSKTKRYRLARVVRSGRG